MTAFVKYDTFPVEDTNGLLGLYFSHWLDTTIFLLSVASLVSLVRNMVNLNEVYEKVWSRFSQKVEPKPNGDPEM